LLGTLVRCDPGFLAWRFGIFKLVRALPEKIGMKLIPYIDNPMIIRANHPSKPKDSGITGCAMLWESHVTVHSWTDYWEVDFDIFSCKPFNYEKALKIFKAFFKGFVGVALVVDRNDGKIIWRYDGDL